MSTRDIVLDGGSPWGFRMHGGADVGHPLRISRVNPGSKAALKGVREGDVISSINGQPTRGLSNSDAHALLRNAGQTLQLGLNQESSGSPKRRIHRSVQQESHSESVKRSSVTKTTTPVNGATDPNSNIHISDKGNFKDGQNGGVKEISTGSTSDSKGQRRRRRQQSTPQHELSCDAKEDSDTVTDKQDAGKTLLSPTFSEGGGSKSRRRRRARGNNRRKCRVGSALGVECGLSGTELKVVEQEREMSTTEPETDATISDVGAKDEECIPHGGEISEVDTVGEVANDETEQKVTFTKVQLTKTSVFSVDVSEVGHEKLLIAGVSSSAVRDVGNEKWNGANVTSLRGREGSSLDYNRKKYTSDAVGWSCDKSERFHEKGERGGGGKSNYRGDVGQQNCGFEDKVTELTGVGTGNTQAVLSRHAILRDIDTQVGEMAGINVRFKQTEREEVIQVKESPEDIKFKFASQECVSEGLREKDVVEVDSDRIKKREKVCEEEEGYVEEAHSVCETYCEDLVMETGVKNTAGVVKGKTELLFNDETDAGIEGRQSDCGEIPESPLISEVSSAEAESCESEGVSATVRKAVELQIESDCNCETKTRISRSDRVAQKGNIQGDMSECNALQSVTDSSNFQFTKHFHENSQERGKEFGLFVQTESDVCCATDAAVLGPFTSLDSQEVGQNASSGCSYGTLLHLPLKTTDVPHRTGDPACGYETVKRLSESVDFKDISFLRQDYECTISGEVRKSNATECQDGRDAGAAFVSGSLETAGNSLQSELCSDVASETETVTTGARNSGQTQERVASCSEISAERDKCNSEAQHGKEAYSVSDEPLLEYRALVVSGGEEVWEEVEELCSTENIDKGDPMAENTMPDGDEVRRGVSNNSTYLRNDQLSQEEKELLDPSPLIDADDEETLRKFLHSLNLADCIREPGRTRNAIPRDGSSEEVYAIRKDKRRAPLETYSSQQRGLDVIVEENSSDCSDGEKRVEEAKTLEKRRGKAWEEALYIPETNEIVFLSNDSDTGEYERLDNEGREESEVLNRPIYYSETRVMSYGMQSQGGICLVYQRNGNETRSSRARFVSEDISSDVFSEDMEDALENARDTAECDSEDGREEVNRACDGDAAVKVELAESSEDEDDMEVKWMRGRARERQDAVEIVYLEDDSGSTSSGSCAAVKKIEEEGAGGSVVEEDPELVYEDVEFPVRLGGIARVTGGVQEGSSGSNPVEVIYENTEFHRNSETALKTQQTETDRKNAEIPDNLQCSAVNESLAGIYEDIEFVREEISLTSEGTSKQYGSLPSVACSKNNVIPLPDTPDVVSVSKSRPHDDNTRECRGKADQNIVTDHLRTTKGDIECGKVTTLDVRNEAKSIRQSESIIEFSAESEIRVPAGDTAVTDDHSKLQKTKPHANSVTIYPAVASDESSVTKYIDGTRVSESINVHDSKMNVTSKTVSTEERISSLMVLRENVDKNCLEAIMSQTSGVTQVESLRENAAEVITVEKDYEQRKGRNEISTQSRSDMDSGTQILLDMGPIYSDELKLDSEFKRAESNVCTKSHRITQETDTNRGGDFYLKTFGKYGECSQNRDRSLLTPSQIDSHNQIETESTCSGQLAYNLNTGAFKCTSDLNLAGNTQDKIPNCGPETYVEPESPVSISGEYGNVRDDEDGFDDLDSITPTNRSPHGSSSSDAGSHGTAFYCPGRFSPQSSDADVSSYAEDIIAENKPLRKIYSHHNVVNKLSKSRSHESISESKQYPGPSFKNGAEIHRKVYVSPKTLSNLCVDKVLSLPYGFDILSVLGVHVPLSPENKHDCKNLKVKTLMRDAVKIFQLLNAPPVSAKYKFMVNWPLSGSLPDISSMQQEALIRDHSSSINTMKSAPAPVSYPLSLAGSDWMGMPTKEDPNLLVCLSPSQMQSYLQGESPTPEEAENLLDLHCKFSQRRGYNENPPPPPTRRVFGIHHFYDETRFPNRHLSDSLHGDTDCQIPPSAGHCAESVEETSAACKHILSPRFRAVLTSLDSKIPLKGNTRSVMDGLKDAQVEEKRELSVKENDDAEDGGGEKERSISRLLAILRASSEPQEIQAKHLSPSSSCSPPPLPPLPCTYQDQFDMLGFLQHNRRPTTFCCSSNDKDFDYLLHHGPPRSPSDKKQNSCDVSYQSPTLQTKGGGKASPWTNSIDATVSKKERVSSWYGQGISDGSNKERLKVKSLSDWLQLVRGGGSSKDSGGTRSKDPTPSVSACASTQSSPGPIRREFKDLSPKPETNRGKDSGMKEHQKLKQEILERRFSLPERQLKQAYQTDQKLIKPPLLPTSAREDARHEQQLKLLQQRQQGFRNQQLSNKTEQTQDKRPPLPQQQSKQKQSEPEAKVQELYCSRPAREEQKQPSPVVQETHSAERRFDADNYHISKKGDIAIINNNGMSRTQKEEQSTLRSKENEDISRMLKSSQRPKSMPTPIESLVTSGEIFRQQMYVEYMDKVAERAERRRNKVIRLSVPREDVPTSETQDAGATAVQHLENEFMGRVRERMDKLGLKYEEESDDGNKRESGADNCYVISGGGAQEMGGGGGDSVCQLPKHLQEFLTIAGGTGSDSDVDGIWSPSLKASTDVTLDSDSKKSQDTTAVEDAPPVVWTPKSAGASPSSERKEFRPVNFESPTLSRKNKSATSTPAPFKPADDFQPTVTTSPFAQESTTTTTFSSIFPPWQQQQSRDDSILSVGSTLQSPTSDKSVASSTITSTLDRRLVQSQSAPAAGLSALAAGGPSSVKLPRAQNPTITLLQKAREGQLPRGALYLDHKMNSKEAEKPYVPPHRILYTVRKEYESEGENEQRKKIVELTPRQYEGIGPTTKEGIPIVLRSEVKDANQAKWYKRMYDSLHRTGKDDEYVTIRYKPRRGHYPYTSPGGYLSEPEPALYDSDIGYSAKYATLDRRRIKNKENDFTTSTLPRSRYVPHPSSIKYATEVYKNQPGRIEDYEPGRSSISEKETKQWWDEVLDIFDGQTNAEPQTTASTPSNKPFMTYALKESGYESDSTLVFKRRDENLQNQLSPAEQKLAYKTIQKGGEVPLHGLRKPAPERPKDISEIEYFPISPHLTRIRVHKQNITPLREIVCYPITTTYTNVPPVFSSYKRTAPSFVQVTPRKAVSQSPPPSPPKRQSSHHCSTLRLWSKMRLPYQLHTGPIRSRHESCFRDTNVNFLRDRLSQKFGINSGSTGIHDRPVRPTRATSSSPLGARASLTAVHRSKSAPESFTSNRKPEVPSSKLHSRKPQHDATGRLSRSPDLAAPMEVRKIVQKQKEKDVRERLGSRSLPPGTVVRSSTLLYSSARNSGLQYHPEDKSLRVTVAVSAKGRELLQPRTVTSAASMMSSVTTTTTTTTTTTITTTTSCKSPSLPLSETSAHHKGNILSRQFVKSVSACQSSPSPSSPMLKTKYAVSSSPSASTTTKGTSKIANKEYMGAVSRRILGSMGTATPSLIELTMDEGNRRTKKSTSADVKKRTKERSLLSSLKTSLSVAKPVGKATSHSADKGLEKEHKNNNKKKVKKSKTDGSGESRQAHVSKRSSAVKSSQGNKGRVNGEDKQGNRTEKKLVSLPRTDKVIAVSAVPSTKELPTQSDSLLDAIPQQNVGPLNTKSFFQHLLLRDIPFPTQSAPRSLCRSSSVLERAREFHEQVTDRTHRRAPFKTESTLGLLNIYLAHKRPVTDSKFRSLDRELSLSSRSPSPSYRSKTFPLPSRVHCLKRGNSRHETDEGMFYSFSPSRSRTPECERREVKVRSSSEPPLLPSVGAVSRSLSPCVDIRQEKKTNTESSAPCQSQTSSPSPTISAACRRIRGARSQIVKTVESIAGLRRKGVRARSAGDVEDTKQAGRSGLKTSPPLHAHSTSSLNISHITDHSEYQSYVMELVHSTRKSERYRDLHKFYSSLERLGQLERAASTDDLRPRLKGETVIDYDRWKQLRTKEKAEKEMKVLYTKLKEDQKEKNLLFESKDTESLRWRGERDRGLRCREKSVEDLRQHFDKLSVEETDLEVAKRKDLDAKKDTYKPLWRGSSVINLANCLATVTNSRRGRPVTGDSRGHTTSRSLSRHSPGKCGKGIGSRLWSSLSMDQVNALKNQLSEIYCSFSNIKREKMIRREDYEISVPPATATLPRPQEDEKEILHVRCNSLLTRDQLYSPLVRRREARRGESMKADSISSLTYWKKNGSKPKPESPKSYVCHAKPLSESEKKRLSMTLSQEVLDRVSKKQKMSSVPVVRARETMGAIAAAAAKGRGKAPSPSSSPALSETISPRTCYSLEMSEEDSSERRASPSRKNDFLLVLTPSDGSHSRHREVEKVVEEWANAKPSSRTVTSATEGKTENGVAARLVTTTSASETESASSDTSTRTVIHRIGSREDVLQKVDYFERKQTSAASDSTGGKTETSARVCRSASDIITQRHPSLTHINRAKSAPDAFHLSKNTVAPLMTPSPAKLRPSQSYADLKELFGEQSRLRYATMPLVTRKREEPASSLKSVRYEWRKRPEDGNVQRSHQDNVSPSRAYYSGSSTDSLLFQRSRSLSPDPVKYWRAYLQMVKQGDVRRLCDKFESLEDLYYDSTGAGTKLKGQSVLKRHSSDPELARDLLAKRGTDTNRVVLRRQEIGDVRWLMRRFETCCRGRSRHRKARALSPVLRIPLRAEDRFMPHINVISKTASLQRHSATTSPQRQAIVSEDEGFRHFSTGEVRRIREKYESQLSLMGQMFTSTPDVRELRDIAPYLGCHWVAHKFPDTQPNTRCLSSPELRTSPPLSVSSSRESRPRPASSSPTRSRRQPLSILKPQQPQQQRQVPAATVATSGAQPRRDVFANQAFDPSIHRPLYRYQPINNASSTGRRYTGSNLWCRQSSPRPTVTFKESPHRYVESEVTIHYRSPVRSEAKEALSEEELARRQAEAMRRIYQEERRRKYLQELQDMHSRRHTDNFTPSQKSPIPLNRYDDFVDDAGNKGKPRDRTPEPKLVARALYNFVGQTSRELSFRRGDIIFVRRQIDKNWFEGEHNAMIGLFPFNYVEIIPYDGIRTIPKRPSEGQARAKFNFFAQTHLELSLVKGELVVLTRRVDDNWFEGRIGNRKGIFPVSYVEVLSEPGEKPVAMTSVAPATKPVTLPASHTVLVNGSGIRQSMGHHSYQPSSYYSQNKMTSSYTSSNPYATLPRHSQTVKQPLAPVNQTLHIDTHNEPVPYRALYNYRPQNEDELELCEGDTVYVMEKCDDGWYVGSSQRTGYFGTFPGNYVERI